MAKTYKNLYSKIYDFSNLLRAYKAARRGKQDRPDIMKYSFDYESRLIELQNHLIYETWRAGPYRTFFLTEPVERIGASLPFYDRVLLHALINVIRPIFERSFVNDTYACIANRGTHKGATKAQMMLRQVNRLSKDIYVFKGDISGYFYNINHHILKNIIQRKIKCKKTLSLIFGIIDSTADPQDINPKGIPLGNLTSQLFANIYLGELDDYIKHYLREKRYARYMDDFCVVSADKQHLHHIRALVEQFLIERLNLRTNKKTQIFKIDRHRSLDFLGYRIWPTHRKVRKGSVDRMKRKLKIMQKQYRNGEISLDKIKPVINSWVAHTSHADSFGLRKKILGDARFSKGSQ